MTPTTIRIEDATKEKAKKIAAELGLSFNSLINSLLKKVIRDGGVDLRNMALTENGFTSEFEEKVIATDKKGDYKQFDSVDDMIKNAK
ncbi:type II toxin-antitoxin system RelB/DinJ family antitoxin [Patescibacteria group bacterium]|nr:type II toxin-antitoxin system RelB/DinJ family antitoxin [Patescibacteria group bacterium]